MRVTLPQRIPFQAATIVAVAFMGVQIVEGTDYAFAILHLVFILLWVYAFNAAGGMTRASGAWVFWFGLLTILVGTMAKAFTGLPADSDTWNGMALMSVYTVSMAVITLCILVTRKLTDNVVSVAGRLRSYSIDYRNTAIGCTMLGLFIPFALGFVNSGQGTIFSIVRQINYFTELGIITGTISVIESSGGRRSWGVLNGLPAAFSFLLGFATFSKQGMFTWLLCWFMGVAFMRYRLSLKQIAALAATIFVFISILTPVSQVGRDLGSDYRTYSEGFVIACDLVVHIDETRVAYQEAAEGKLAASGSYYGRDIGLLSRLSRIESDDPLISYSLQGHYLGYGPVGYAFLNWFPHLILPDKEKYATTKAGGNYYGHELGILSAADTTTGVSFGSPAEAFHLAGWTGVILLQLMVDTMLFLSVDLLCGDLRRSPWGLFFAMAFAHVAPEGSLLGTIQFVAQGNFGLFCAMVFSTYAAPVIGSLLTSSAERRSGPPGSVEIGRFVHTPTAAQ